MRESYSAGRGVSTGGRDGMMNPMKYAITVTTIYGETKYLMNGDAVALFDELHEAESQKHFMEQGLEDEVQSIDVVNWVA